MFTWGTFVKSNHSFRISRSVHIVLTHIRNCTKCLRQNKPQEKWNRINHHEQNSPKKDKKKKKEKKEEKKSGTPGAGPNPCTSSGGNNDEMTLRQANLDSGDSQTWPDPDTLMPPQMVAQLEEQVTLPWHVLIEGMDTSFIKYFWKHGMTPILMHTLETKRGLTDDMITHFIQNCNRAWGLSHVAPQEMHNWDEIDTDEEPRSLS